MPYRIKHGSGARPYQIIRLADGKVVGTSVTRQAAQGSIAHRMENEPKDVKGYKRKVDNKMGVYGETDFDKKVIRVNKKLSKSNPTHKRPVNKHAKKYPEVLDTIVHERTHVEHPKMLEKTVRKVTRKKMVTMKKKDKQKNYGMFK